MSDSGSNAGGVSPWWTLLLLPLALGAGWLAGQAPAPAPREVARESHSVIGSAGSRPAAASALASRDDSPGPAQEPSAPEYSQWTSFEGAIEESKRNGKPILIDFNAEWCGPCRALKSQVFDDAARGGAIQAEVIPVSIVDRTREDGQNPSSTEELQRRFGVEAFPTLVVFNPATGRSEKTRGYGDADAAVRWITGAARSVR